MACDRPVFMGDIIVDADTTCSLETTSGISSIAISKGSWFANAIVFWAYIQQEHNTQTGDSIDFIIRIYPDSPAPISPEILYFENTGDTILSDTIDNANLGDIVGWVDGDITANGGLTANIQYVFRPTYPIHTYNKSVEIDFWDTAVSESGRTTGNIGIHTTIVDVGLSISGENNSNILVGNPHYQERFYWDALWNSHWRKGRAVTCYINQQDIEDQSLNDMYPYVRNGDILVLPTNKTVIRSDRLVPYSNSVHKTDSFRFIVRQPYPLTAKNTQGSRLL